MEAGELLRTVRRRRGLSQGELARRPGRAQPLISAYEPARRGPTLGTLRRLVAAAGEQLIVTADVPPSDLPPGDLDHHQRGLLDVLSLPDALAHRPRASTLRAPRLVSS